MTGPTREYLQWIAHDIEAWLERPDAGEVRGVVVIPRETLAVLAVRLRLAAEELPRSTAPWAPAVANGAGIMPRRSG